VDKQFCVSVKTIHMLTLNRLCMLCLKGNNRWKDILRRKIFMRLIVATSALIISFGGLAAVDNYKAIKADQAEIIRLESEQQRLQQEREELEESHSETKKQLKQQKKTEQELRKQIEALKVSKAKREARRLAISAPVSAESRPDSPIAAGWHYECRSQREAVRAAVNELGLGSSWSYIDYIFGRESCHDPGRLNSSGCRGLGQACPGSKLPCGPTDIRCQVKWFNGYAQGKGGWAASYRFWLANHWW